MTMLTRCESLRPRLIAYSGFTFAVACCVALAGCKAPWVKEESAIPAALQAQADAAYENGEWQQAAASLQTLANAAQQATAKVKPECARSRGRRES